MEGTNYDILDVINWDCCPSSKSAIRHNLVTLSLGANPINLNIITMPKLGKCT